METLYSLINVAILVGGILLGYGFHRLFKMWLIILIDHKIKVHNESMLSIIEKCNKVVEQCKLVTKESKEYVDKSDIQIKKMEQLCNDSINLNKEFQSNFIKNNSSK